jgi:ribose transport system substrate-binding protein
LQKVLAFAQDNEREFMNGVGRGLAAAAKKRGLDFRKAVAEIKKGGGPYKTSVNLASPVFGYAMGEHAADWLDGKSIPQAMDILPKALTAQNMAQYEADLANPGAVYADPPRRESCLKMYGNICYDIRDQYVNFPWSSERH